MLNRAQRIVAPYWRLARMDRPIGIYLLLWPTLWALWLAAEGPPPPSVLLVFVLGTVLTRAAGCAVNDYADRGFDGEVARTRQRPLVSGQLAAWQALVFAAVLGVLALALALSLRNLTVLLLALPAAAVATVYPYCKRFLATPQAVLGLAFSFGIPMAYAALREQLPWPEVGLLMLANMAWVVAYDTWYAMVDRNDDLRIGVHSTAILLGRHDRLVIALLQATALLLLIQLGFWRDLGAAYHAGLALAAWLAVWQQWITRSRDRDACLRAFLNNHYFGAAIFVGIVVALYR